ncbi:MAG: SLC13 family permease [Parvularculaceae bacterium]
MPTPPVNTAPRRAAHRTGLTNPKRIGLIAGPSLAALALALAPLWEGLSPAGVGVLALTTLIAVWWVTEAIPIPATSLLPAIFVPFTGALGLREALAGYANPIIFLFLGGFVIATSLERWNLHTRIALNVVARSGASPAALIAGFMLAAAGLSMWISNTATALMMTPIALSVAAAVLGKDYVGRPFALALLLGIAFSCSIGGRGTLVGTPTNAIVKGYIEAEFGREIGFAEWMALGLPVVAVLLPIAWLCLTRLVFRLEAKDVAGAPAIIRERLAGLGPITTPETRVAIVFALVAAAWMFRRLIVRVPGLETLSDTAIALIGAVALFVVPAGAGEKGEALLDWETAAKLPWGILLIFGGGLSLAAAISASGLAAWLGGRLEGLTSFHPIMLIFAVTVLVVLLTELTSNVATATALMPVLGAIATAGRLDPMLLAAPAAMAASCAFMLPVATPPNAIVFASGAVRIVDMARAGVALNVFSALVLTVMCYVLVPIVFGRTAT